MSEMSWHESVSGPRIVDREDSSTPIHGTRRLEPLSPISAVSKVQHKRDEHYNSAAQVSIDAGGGADLMFIEASATSMLDNDHGPALTVHDKKSHMTNDCENITTKTNPFIPRSSLNTTKQTDQQNGDNKFFGINPTVPKKNLAQKKVLLYPDMAKIYQEDSFLYAFLGRDYGDPFKGQTIVDPDKMEYSNPDFGFDNFLNFDA